MLFTPAAVADTRDVMMSQKRATNSYDASEMLAEALKQMDGLLNTPTFQETPRECSVIHPCPAPLPNNPKRLFTIYYVLRKGGIFRITSVGM